MRLFKTPAFQKDFGKSPLDDAALRLAMIEIANGLVEAELGGYLVKKRIARQGTGKSRGYRTIIAVRADDRALFLHLFAKNETANISTRELVALKALAKHYMSLSKDQLNIAVLHNVLMEIT
jgi:hypothetical protein